MPLPNPFAEWEFFDVSVPVAPGIPAWPGDPAMISEPFSLIANGDACNLAVLHMSGHTGTHVDPPWHFIDDGARLDQVPVERWFGPCVVMELADDVLEIEPAHLEAAEIPAGTERLLFKTSNSHRWRPLPMPFEEDFVALSPSGARWVADRGIGLVGIDYLSIEGWNDSANETHRTLLGEGVLILEGLNLTGIEPGDYFLFCLPLHLQGADGAPARALLARPGK